MCTKPLFTIVYSHFIMHNSLDDDLQLQTSAPPDKISKLLQSMQPCIGDVKAWTTVNILRLNKDNTDLMLVTTKKTNDLHNLPTSFTIGDALNSIQTVCEEFEFHIRL